MSHDPGDGPANRPRQGDGGQEPGHNADALEPQAFLPGEELLGRFLIVRLLGAGAMGEVYEAEDTELREHIAIKTIRSARSSETLMLDRLRKEVQLGRRVAHPNVCRVFDVFRTTVLRDHGPSVSCAIVTMELLKGGTLASHIRRNGPIPADEALGIARQLCDGLSAAHRAGIIHRDFKSSNVLLVADGNSPRAVITDFGLATTAAGTAENRDRWSELSTTGEVVGTPAYISPEQLRGEPATVRSDIYALGIVLYEMVSGKLPFAADTPLAVAVKRLHTRPDDLRLHNAELPRTWYRTIEKCLAMDPRERFADAADVATSLDPAVTSRSRKTIWGVVAAAVASGLLATAGTLYWRERTATPADAAEVSTVVAKPMRRSVALLGFRNVSARADEAYISTTFVEGLGTELARDDQLRIVSSEEVARVKRELSLTDVDTLAPDSLEKVRASLGSDLLVLGSYTAVGAEGDRQVRIDLRIQDTQSGEIIGADSYTGPLVEVFDLIEDSGRAVRKRLGLSELRAEGPPPPSALPSSPDARRLYSDGLDALRAFNAQRARDLFNMVIAGEPGFALAHVALASALSTLGYDAEAVREAEAALNGVQSARREQRLWIEGLHHEYTRDWTGAIRSYSELVDAYPDEPEYRLKLAEAQTSAGKPMDALATLKALARALPAFAGDARVAIAEAAAADTLGDPAHMERAARSAIATADKTGSRLLLARASIALARALELRGDAGGALQVNETARRTYEEAGDRRGVARALIQIGALLRTRAQLADAERQLRTALTISRDLGTQRQTAQALNELGNVLFDRRQFASAADAYKEAVDVNRDIGDMAGEARTLGNLASVRYEQGNIADALRLDEQALKIKRTVGNRLSIAFSLANMAETASDLGRLDAARQMYEESRSLYQALNAKSELSSVMLGQATLAMRRGELDAAQRLIEQALQVRTDLKDTPGTADAHVAAARLALLKQDAASAEAALGRARLDQQLTPEVAAKAALLRAALLLRSGQGAAAREALGNVAPQAAEYSLATRVDLDLTQARLLAAEGRTGDAAKLAQQVAARNRRSGLVSFELEAELALLNLQPRNEAQAAALARRARAAGFVQIAREAEAQGRRPKA